MKKIKIEKNELVIRIPLKAKVRNQYMEDEDLGEMDNILGMIAGDEMGFSNYIDMSYCGKAPQFTDMFYRFWGTNEEFKQLCKELGLYCHEYETCSECKKPIYGSFTLGDKGPVCYDCMDED